MALDNAHDLLPDEFAATVPRLYATEREPDPLARLKLFTPDSSWTWFITEYDPEQHLCFGLIIGHDREFGYFSLDELREVRGPLGLPIERDLYFEPKPLSQCGGRS
jgi:hypothetical protein